MEVGLGIDLGGVIAEKADADNEHPAQLPPDAINPLPNAFRVIAEMNELLRGRVWIVSKAGPGTERKIREWLKHHRFAELTGVGPQQVHFVRDRSEKLERCRQLGLTHFVDDQLKTLEILSGHVNHLYLFGGDSARSGIVAVQDWLELGGLLRQSFVAEERKES